MPLSRLENRRESESAAPSAKLGESGCGVIVLKLRRNRITSSFKVVCRYQILQGMEFESTISSVT
jgi:hypothetical protein